MYSLLPSAALAMTASFCEALMGLSPPAPTEAPSAVALGSVRVVFANWAVAASTLMIAVVIDDTRCAVAWSGGGEYFRRGKYCVCGLRTAGVVETEDCQAAHMAKSVMCAHKRM